LILTPKNWKSFQHYKDRAPAWIKLHKALLDDYEFSCLPVASRALAPMLWLLASEYDDGKITASLDKLAFRLHMTRGDLADALSPLLEKGFFEASEPLAERKHDAIPEKEGEEENIDKRERENASAIAPPLDPSIPEREYFLRGREVLGNGAGGLIGKLLKARGGNVALARAAIEQASQKQNPTEYVAAICRGPPMVKPQTAHQVERQTGRDILDDIGKFISGSGGEASSGVLRHDTGNGPESVRGRAGGNLIELSPSRAGKSG
jgi:hypothetical protein